VIVNIIRNAHPDQIVHAIVWTADNLHVPPSLVSYEVAVAYVCKHFAAGQLTGWDGFIEDIGL
jgi:hypothetical protein